MRSSFNGDNIVLYTRADFPHVLAFEPKTISSVTLCDLIRADDPSPFPALSQMEVYGYWE